MWSERSKVFFIISSDQLSEMLLYCYSPIVDRLKNVKHIVYKNCIYTVKSLVEKIKKLKNLIK